MSSLLERGMPFHRSVLGMKIDVGIIFVRASFMFISMQRTGWAEGG